MGLRFRRSIRVFPGLRLNVSPSGVSASIGRRGSWLTFGPRGTRATVGIPGTGLSYTEQSPWARPKSAHDYDSPVVPGIEVAELPRVEIEVPPVREPAATPAPLGVDVDDDVAHADPALVWIAVAIAVLIGIGAIAWALLI